MKKSLLFGILDSVNNQVKSGGQSNCQHRFRIIVVQRVRTMFYTFKQNPHLADLWTKTNSYHYKCGLNNFSNCGRSVTHIIKKKKEWMLVAIHV